MDDMNRYYKEALLDNLCAEYKGYWQASRNDKERLVRLVAQQQSLPHFITYSYNGKGLSRNYITENFADYINGNHVIVDADGVDGNYKTELYVGFNGILSPADDILAFMWSSVPQLEIKATKAVKMYAGCKSDVHIACDGYNYVTVMLFDESKVTLDDVDENSYVVVFKYSDKCEVNTGKYCFGNIKQFRKELRL